MLLHVWYRKYINITTSLSILKKITVRFFLFNVQAVTEWRNAIIGRLCNVLSVTVWWHAIIDRLCNVQAVTVCRHAIIGRLYNVQSVTVWRHAIIGKLCNIQAVTVWLHAMIGRLVYCFSSLGIIFQWHKNGYDHWRAARRVLKYIF